MFCTCFWLHLNEFKYAYGVQYILTYCLQICCAQKKMSIIDSAHDQSLSDNSWSWHHIKLSTSQVTTRTHLSTTCDIDIDRLAPGAFPLKWVIILYSNVNLLSMIILDQSTVLLLNWYFVQNHIDITFEWMWFQFMTKQHRKIFNPFLFCYAIFYVLSSGGLYFLK